MVRICAMLIRTSDDQVEGAGTAGATGATADGSFAFVGGGESEDVMDGLFCKPFSTSNAMPAPREEVGREKGDSRVEEEVSLDQSPLRFEDYDPNIPKYTLLSILDIPLGRSGRVEQRRRKRRPPRPISGAADRDVLSSSRRVAASGNVGAGSSLDGCMDASAGAKGVDHCGTCHGGEQEGHKRKMPDTAVRLYSMRVQSGVDHVEGAASASAGCGDGVTADASFAFVGGGGGEDGFRPTTVTSGLETQEMIGLGAGSSLDGCRDGSEGAGGLNSSLGDFRECGPSSGPASASSDRQAIIPDVADQDQEDIITFHCKTCNKQGKPGKTLYCINQARSGDYLCSTCWRRDTSGLVPRCQVDTCDENTKFLSTNFCSKHRTSTIYTTAKFPSVVIKQGQQIGIVP